MLSGLWSWVSILAPSSLKREGPGRVKVFDPCVNNLSLKLGKGPGQWQALAGLIGRRTGSARQLCLDRECIYHSDHRAESPRDGGVHEAFKRPAPRRIGEERGGERRKERNRREGEQILKTSGP